MPLGTTTRDENHSPSLEGCRGGLTEAEGPTPKATPSAPPREGIFKGAKQHHG